MKTLALVLSLIANLHPNAQKVGSPATWASTISYVVDHEPLPEATSKGMAAAILVVNAWEEGKFCLGCRRGDIGVHKFGSACTFQIMARSENHARLLEANPTACTQSAYYTIRESIRLCPEYPLAPYVGGCKSVEAQRISTRRVNEAVRILQAVKDQSAVDVGFQHGIQDHNGVRNSTAM